MKTEYDEVKTILDKHDVSSIDDIEYGSEVYEDLFGYYMDSGEMPYGIMKARTGDPDVWIADRIDELGLLSDEKDKDGNLVKSHKYELLSICEFDSTRKRMSVILRDENG